jgi:hypothetical protein
MAATAARRAENEAAFRALNERLEDRVLARNGSSDTEMLIVCECSREDCTERISLSVGEYELVRSRSRLFIVVSGHADPQIERVVLRHESHEIVEKAGEAGLVADLTATRESG